MRFRLILCACLLLCGCRRSTSSLACDYHEVEARLEEGDLLFRCGTGLVGRMVTSMDREGEFSHVGIVVCHKGEWSVVHAVPHEPEFQGDFDRVKCEPVADFLGRYAEVVYGIYRPQVEAEKRHLAARHALRQYEKRVPFDHDYNTEDTTRLYCTELAEYCYALVGLPLSQGRRTEVTFPSLAGSYIFPSDLTRSENLKRVNEP